MHLPLPKIQASVFVSTTQLKADRSNELQCPLKILMLLFLIMLFLLIDTPMIDAKPTNPSLFFELLNDQRT
jgi:hypothetical protein